MRNLPRSGCVEKIKTFLKESFIAKIVLHYNDELNPFHATGLLLYLLTITKPDVFVIFSGGVE